MNCITCNETNLIPIIYGTPNQDLVESAKRDEIVLGGKIRKSYTHYCSFCQETYPTKQI